MAIKLLDVFLLIHPPINQIKMASTISNSLQKALNVNSSSSNAKLADLAKDTVNGEEKNARITTDFGVKVSNTDHWLSASSDQRQGPALLEDFHGREKVSKQWWV